MYNNFYIPQYGKNNIFLKKICSFVSRKRRLKDSKKEIIRHLWPQLGLDFAQSSYLNFKTIFNNNYPVVLEIGFGNGQSFVDMAEKHVSKNFLGIEVYINGVCSCFKLINQKKINNVKIIIHDAVEVLFYMVLDHSLSIIQLFFPDPWPKNRHRKRRIINLKFVTLISKKLVSGGLLHLVTDSEVYAKEIIQIINNTKEFVKLFNYSDQSFSRLVTKFEKKGLDAGHQIIDLRFIKI